MLTGLTLSCDVCCQPDRRHEAALIGRRAGHLFLPHLDILSSPGKRRGRRLVCRRRRELCPATPTLISTLPHILQIMPPKPLHMLMLIFWCISFGDNILQQQQLEVVGFAVAPAPVCVSSWRRQRHPLPPPQLHLSRQLQAFSEMQAR